MAPHRYHTAASSGQSPHKRIKVRTFGQSVPLTDLIVLGRGAGDRSPADGRLGCDVTVTVALAAALVAR